MSRPVIELRVRFFRTMWLTSEDSTFSPVLQGPDGLKKDLR